MFQIRRLYCVPELFDPIDFTSGVNLLLGEKAEGNQKTNAVGKSLAIEFLNFGLLKELRHSRLRLIPEDVLPRDTLVCVQFTLAGREIELRRSIEGHERPAIVEQGCRTEYESLADATRHLSNLMFGESNDENVPTFRTMMGPLIRDERSEFKSIVKCYDTDLRIPPDYTPHLYLLGIQPGPYCEARRLRTQIERAGTAESKARSDIRSLTGKQIGDARAELNELTSQVERIQQEVDALENVAGYEMVRDELVAIEADLNKSRARQAVLKGNLSRIDMFRGDTYIDAEEIRELYNQFRGGLGDAIKRNLDEVTAFKRKIDEFQMNLIGERRQSIVRELREVDGIISQLDRRYSAKLKVIDQSGALTNLKQTLAVHREKAEEHAALGSAMERYTTYEREKREFKANRAAAVELLSSYKDDAQSTIDAVESTILRIHEYVMGNRQCSFEVDVDSSADVVRFSLRIHDDGSHSVDREKVFMYDMAMLLSVEVAERHPGFLVHDNIFDVDKDTLIRSLNYLADNPGLLADRQYILTLNRDEFGEEDLRTLRLDLPTHARGTYTKASKFLRRDYQELNED